MQDISQVFSTIPYQQYKSDKNSVKMLRTEKQVAWLDNFALEWKHGVLRKGSNTNIFLDDWTIKKINGYRKKLKHKHQICFGQHIGSSWTQSLTWHICRLTFHFNIKNLEFCWWLAMKRIMICLHIRSWLAVDLPCLLCHCPLDKFE